MINYKIKYSLNGRYSIECFLIFFSTERYKTINTAKTVDIFLIILRTFDRRP